MNKVNNRTCPVCRQNGKDTPLELRQINLTEAVYICQDRNCIYPIGFQWEYIKNNILDDSDESSDDTSDRNIFTLTCNNINKKILHLANESSIKQTPQDTKEKVNIISNILLEKSEHIINTKNGIKTNEIIKCNENIRKYNLRNNNKTKGQNVPGGALPESIVKNAKALSKYFSTTTNETKKPKTNIKSVFDIIQAPVNKQKKSNDNILSKEVKQKIISNTSIEEHNYSAKEKKCDEVNSDINNLLENALTNPEEKFNNDLTETFDELLFGCEDKCDTRNQSLDLSEMDELLSFL